MIKTEITFSLPRFALRLSLLPLFALAFAAILSLSAPAKAGDNGSLGVSYYSNLTCGQLWYERNSIYARAGHCFRSRRAIRTFGRACFPPYGRLNAQWQNVVNEIRYFERRNGC